MQVKIYIRIALCVFVSYHMEFFNFWGIENKYLKLSYIQILNQKKTKEEQSFFKVRLKLVK